MVDAERKDILKHTPEGVVERPEEMEIPYEVEHKEGVTAVKSQFTSQISDDKGSPLTVSPTTQKVTITLPDEEEKLIKQSKGDSDDTKTWFARFWLRIIKRAVNLGWNIKQKINP